MIKRRKEEKRTKRKICMRKRKKCVNMIKIK
jgi:hypothetical protein